MVDEHRQRSEWLWSKALVTLLVCTWFSACQRNSTFPNVASVLPEWRAAFPAEQRVRGLLLDPDRPLPRLDPRSTLVVVDQNWRVPDGAAFESQRTALREFVQNGGRLLLFGHAARMVFDLDIEAERPECSVYRWGFDRRSVQGQAELTIHVISGQEPELFDGLTGTITENSFPITGGTPCNLPLCSWRYGAPQSGTVLAQLGEVLDGQPATSLGPPVLLQWRVGHGHVLACGLLPDLHHEEETVRANARQFINRCADWAERHGSDELVLLEVPDRTPVEATLAKDGPPMVPWLAHWGWQVSIYDGEEQESVRPPDELLRESLLPGWQHGADVVELSLTDVQHGAPLSWSKGDPIEAPESFRGKALGGAWTSGGFRRFADEAHSRGMLVFGGMDPLPVGDRPVERLVALRMLARELASLRRYGAGAFDGFGFRQWWQDQQGHGLAMVQDYQPAGQLYCVGERMPQAAGGLRAMDADDGGLRGLSLAGIGDGWREGFPGDLYPVGVLDARAISDRWPGSGVRGGGSHGDWLVRQVNEFVRERRLTGGTALWRRHDPRTLGPNTANYVNGLGLEPLRAAVAVPLATTGRDGIRAMARTLVEDAPESFGGEVDAPASVHVLQNNWFRLLGSGGALAFDAKGLARFDEHATTISKAFCATRLFGGRPDGTELYAERVDFLAHGYRGEGGYGKSARVSFGNDEERRSPALLGLDQNPRWPSSVAYEWQPTTGYHELRLRLRSERGGSLVAIYLDDVLLRCVANAGSSRSPEVLVPVHIATPGRRDLRLQILEGHSVAIDHLQLSRVGEIGVEAEVLVPAGSLAQLVERSNSSYHEEHVTLTAMADVPGFVMHTQCVKAARNLQVERHLSLPRYARVTATTPGDDAKAHRMPFVLTSTDASVPDLCIVPLKMSRYDRLEVEDGAVVWRSSPEAGLAARVAFMFWPHGRGHEVLRYAKRLMDHIDHPVEVDLGPDGKADLVSDLPIAKSRLLHVLTGSQTPFLVRERGYWTWRGCQPATDGGVWLRIHQEPGDVVQIVAGPTVLARTRPGPGSLRVVALQEPLPRTVTATVLQRSRLRAPSVVMATDFQQVLLDGKPWSWFDGRTIYLPDVPGVYQIETTPARGTLVRGMQPHVRSTAAPLSSCEFDPKTHELVFETSQQHSRPAGLPWTAILMGPVPDAIENGEIVDPASLHLPDDAARAAAARGGVLIRFRSGKTTVRYAGWNAAAGR
tara:strand:+ start:29181 stop:32849 length:3669 start_codon:yes stop_codon:yes gene_type:complete